VASANDHKIQISCKSAPHSSVWIRPVYQGLGDRLYLYGIRPVPQNQGNNSLSRWTGIVSSPALDTPLYNTSWRRRDASCPVTVQRLSRNQRTQHHSQ